MSAYDLAERWLDEEHGDLSADEITAVCERLIGAEAALAKIVRGSNLHDIPADIRVAEIRAIALRHLRGETP